MRHLLIQALLILSITFCPSCRNNPLKTNEKELAKEIHLQEKEKNTTGRTAPEKSSSETGNRLSGSSRKKEIRSTDPQRPPINLDVLGTNKNIRIFKLSDIASSIKYVKLQKPPDTSLLYDPFYYRRDMISSVRSDGEQIIFQGLFGLTRFNMQGEYQETVWKNKTGIKFYGSGVIYGGKDFFGVQPSTPVSLSNGNLYYTFFDGLAGTVQVMKYKPGTNKNLSVQLQTEIPGPGIIPGDTLLSTNNNPFEGFDRIFGIGTDNWVGISQKWNAGKSGSLLVTYNDKDDTLCQFTDYDRIVNFNKTTYRNSNELSTYYYNGQLTFKPEYNDTVFRLIPPDRLLPVYIIGFGNFKVNYMDGLNPDFDLSDKYLIYTLHETDNFLLIRFTQNYDSPNTRKKSTVKFYNAIFDKNEGKLFHQPGFSQIPEDIINDLDGGMPFWPDFITPRGEMMKLVSGKKMKDYINSTGFKEKTISEENRQKQISLVSGLKPTDMIVVIVK
jgi:hypothetical protein